MSEDYQEPNLQTIMLVLLAHCQYITRRSLLLLKEEKTKGYYAINHLKKNRFVEEKRVKQKVKDKYRYETCYCITADGLNFLKKQSKMFPMGTKHDPYFEWLKEVPAVGSLSFGVRGAEQDSILRHLSFSTMNTIAYTIGASYVPAYVNESEGTLASERSLQSIVLNAVANATAELESEVSDAGYLNSSSPIRYTNSRIIKQVLLNNGADISALQFGRYAGIFEAPERSVLVYGPAKSGLGWGKRTVSSENVSYCVFLGNRGMYCETMPVQADVCMFVENAKMFADILNDKDDKRYGVNLGEGVKSFYFFPLTHTGVMSFKKFLTTDLEEYQKAFFEQAISSGIYKENDNELLSHIFPLKDASDDTYVFDGTYMDAHHIQQLIGYLSENPVRYKILCYEFLIDYYNRIFDPAAFKLIRSSF